MTNVQIYVGTYAKYNSGSIYGAWLKLEDYSDYEELQNAMRNLHKDEEDLEFMFQEYECSEAIESLGLISECHISKNIYEVMGAIENFDYNEEVIEAYICSLGSSENDIQEILEKVSESYFGEYSSDVEFIQELLEETGDLSADLPPYIHIDWERTAYDIMMDYSVHNNHYFRLM
ncbi:antirestriction protein ArdA [Polaribacter sp. IC073]|uniref:antirestriction protein ArdA n=1 Tax=Polaribacter sp. IC073 TaxID=2508540 RepID=UPI0011BE4972|nr:antirestriction protein ArdA [Polaribacter sp. IC073]TXD48678.1 antirestriction protein ArdA [Polaribacter sp. IC073]